MNVETFLTQLCEHTGLESEEFEIKLNENENEIKVELIVPEDDSGIFIGHHGEGVDSIQRVMRISFQNAEEDKKISLNINGYREKREERLKDLTYSIGNKVLDTGRDYTFNSYLPAHERFIVHSTLSSEEEFSALESVSDGMGRNRQLTIRLKSE